MYIQFSLTARSLPASRCEADDTGLAATQALVGARAQTDGIIGNDIPQTAASTVKKLINSLLTSTILSLYLQQSRVVF